MSLPYHATKEEVSNAICRRMETKLKDNFGVLSVDDSDGILWISVAVMGAIQENDALITKGAKANMATVSGRRVFKVLRRDMTTISALEAALHVEQQKRKKN